MLQTNKWKNSPLPDGNYTHFFLALRIEVKSTIFRALSSYMPFLYWWVQFDSSGHLVSQSDVLNCMACNLRFSLTRGKCNCPLCGLVLCRKCGTNCTGNIRHTNIDTNAANTRRHAHSNVIFASILNLCPCACGSSSTNP